MKKIRIMFGLLVGCLLVNQAFASTSDDVQQMINTNLQASEEQNLDKYMSTMHSQSLSYLATKLTMQSFLNKGYKLDYVLSDFKFIGEDNEYAYARVSIETKKVSGPVFNNNRLQALMVFKKEDSQWKIWSQANLKVEYIQ